MSLKAGIVGLPNVGKSTLFNAITNSHIEAANYPFATIEPNSGIVELKDERVDHLVEIFAPRRVVRATFEFIDIAGLVKGASKGEGLGNQFLANIRNVDAICHVVRCFENPDIIHVENTINPLRDIETINLELIFADLDTVNKRLGKVETKARTSKDKASVEECNLLTLLKSQLEKELPLRNLEFSKEQNLLLKSYGLLTLKPVIYVANVSEEDYLNLENSKHYQTVVEYAKKEHAEVVAISAAIEEELSSLDEEDKMAYLNDLGMKDTGLNRLVSKAYSLLSLSTFFTVGQDEVRAWTFKNGMKAPQCAGIIHSDFEKGFIKAEIYSYDDLVKYGSEQAIKDNGKYRSEGKDYVVQDGDCLLIRFNV